MTGTRDPHRTAAPRKTARRKAKAPVRSRGRTRARASSAAPDSVQALSEGLGLKRADFSRLLGASERAVAYWIATHS